MEAFHKDKRGTLETLPDGRVRLYRATVGYVAKTGGYTTKARRAETFAGAGEAIRRAAVLGFAVVRGF